MAKNTSEPNKPNGDKPKSVEDAAKIIKSESKPEGETPEEKPKEDGTNGTETKPEGENQPEVKPDADADGKPKSKPEGENGASTDGPGPEVKAPEEGAKPEEDKKPETEEDQPTKPASIELPTAEEIENSATMLADNPELFVAFKKTAKRTEEIIAERKLGPKKTAEEMEAANYERLVKQYGKDFVTAERGTNKTYFKRSAWNSMKDKRGWKEITKEMPEATTATGPAQPAAQPKKLNGFNKK